MKIKNIIVFIALPVIVAGLAIWTILRIWPDDNKSSLASVVKIDCKRNYILTDKNGHSLFFAFINADSLMEGLTWDKRNIINNETESEGFWINQSWLYPSCEGKIISSVSDTTDIIIKGITPKNFIDRQIEYLTKENKKINQKQSELKYYLRVHGVQDEGYNMVATYATRMHAYKDSINKKITILKGIQKSNNIKIYIKDQYIATYKNKDKQNIKQVCYLIKKSLDSRIQLLSNYNQTTPNDVNAVSIMLWKSDKKKKIMAVSYKFETPCPEEIADNGSGIYTETLFHKGLFAGIKTSNGIIWREQIHTFINNK